MSYQVLQRVTGRRETRRIDLPIVGWASTRGGTVGSTPLGSCFVVINGSIYTWFREDPAETQTNESYILGDTRSELFTPGKIEAISNVERAAVGYAHGLALTASGRVFAWGDNASGQLGFEIDTTGDGVPYSTAREIPSLSGISYIFADTYVSAFVDSGGSAYVTGNPFSGVAVYVPERLDLPNKVLEIAGNAQYWAYVDINGNAYRFRWDPAYGSGETNVSEHTSIWSEGGLVQVRNLPYSEHKFFFRHTDGGICVGGSILEGITARHISNGGSYINGDGALAAALFGVIHEGPYTESGGVVCRDGDRIYAFNPEGTEREEIII